MYRFVSFTITMVFVLALLTGAVVHRGSEKGQLERPQVLLIDGEPSYLYVATGINTEAGFGSCSHVFKLNLKR